MKGEGHDEADLMYFDRQQIKTVERQLLRNQRAEGRGQRQLANTMLDCNFPYTGDADHLFIGDVLNQIARPLAQVMAARDESQKHMSVEQ